MDPMHGDIPRAVEQIYINFLSRRAGIIKALTSDSEKFFEECDPENYNLCLYGLPNEQWRVSLPFNGVPPELPEPTLGINFARDGMRKKHWFSLVAIHCDSWLLSVAFYLGAHSGLDKNGRDMLFQMINEIPTVTEVLHEKSKHTTEEDDHGDTCFLCGDYCAADEFWTRCNECEEWFHGHCIRIIDPGADTINYKCLVCRFKSSQS